MTDLELDIFSREADNDFKNMEKYLPKEYWEYMMYMGRKNNIYLYKHVNTRRYVNIDDNGIFYKYTEQGYIEISKKEAINYLLS